VRIHDGSVSGFESAVSDENSRAYHTTVERVIAFNQSGDAIRLRHSSTVRECDVKDSGGVGIYAQNSIIIDNIVGGTGSDGILGPESRVTGNRIDTAGGNGILVTSTSLVSGNFIRTSASHGIEATHAATVTGNVIMNAGTSGISGFPVGGSIRNNTIWGFGLHGIDATRGQISNNSIDDSGSSPTGFGMNFGPRTGYSYNTVSTVGQPVSGGNDAGGNVCNFVLDGC